MSWWFREKQAALTEPSSRPKRGIHEPGEGL
jgi:hypothetical protein